MGIQTVTGVSGPGSSDGMHRGPQNGRNIYVPLQSPHVVAAGTVALVGGAATITFPSPLAGSKTGYSVILTSETANAGYVSAKTDVSGYFASFAITGTGTNTINWAVMKSGYA